MARFRKYVPSSSKTGYYIRDRYNDKIITYQVTTFAEKLLLDLGYTDKDQISREAFFLLKNTHLIYTKRSGVDPVESLQNPPNFDDEEVASLSTHGRRRLLKSLLNNADLTSEQREDLERYISNSDIDLHPKEMNQSISSSKRTEINESFDREACGTVDFFNDTGGYGFIATDVSDEDVFYHMEDVGGPDIQEGTDVAFDIIPAKKGPRATNVIRLEECSENVEYSGVTQSNSVTLSDIERHAPIDQSIIEELANEINVDELALTMLIEAIQATVDGLNSRTFNVHIASDSESIFESGNIDYLLLPYSDWWGKGQDNSFCLEVENIKNNFQNDTVVADLNPFNYFLEEIAGEIHKRQLSKDIKNLGLLYSTVVTRGLDDDDAPDCLVLRR